MANQKGGIQRDWQGKLTGCQYVFGGINNIIDPSNIDLEKGECYDAVNVDFDNTNSANRRSGYSAITSGGSYHSSWSNDTKTLAYMVLNGVICEWDGDGLPVPLIVLSNNNRCEFCQVNNVVVYSNGTDFGIIEGSNYQTRTYSDEFKTATLGGRNLEFYNGRLYYSIDNRLHCTDVFDVEHTDIRYNHVATFQHTITMCKRVEDGLVVGTEKYVYFLKGDDIREGGFEQIILAKAGVVYGTACKTNAEYVPEAQNSNNLVLFLTTAGICSVGNGGKYVNHSFNTVTLDVGATGTATIRQEHGISQYVVVFDTDSNYEYNPYNSNIELDVHTL